MNLFVGNLSLETTEEDLRKLFSEFGEINSVKVLAKADPATGAIRKFAFVDMADKFHSYDAIDNIDSTYLHGNIITVKEAKPTGQQGGGGQRRGGGGFNRRPSGGGFNRREGGGFNRREGGNDSSGYNRREGGNDGGFNRREGGERERRPRYNNNNDSNNRY